jgi:hypothetical protein
MTRCFRQIKYGTSAIRHALYREKLTTYQEQVRKEDTSVKVKIHAMGGVCACKQRDDEDQKIAREF